MPNLDWRSVARGLAATLAIGFLAACTTPATVPPPAISFKDRPPLRLDVANVAIVPEYAPPRRDPNIEHVMPLSPQIGVERWVEDRLLAEGSSGTANVIIRRASVVEQALPRTGGLRGVVEVEQSERYTAQLDVEVTIEKGAQSGRAETSVVRSMTVPENATLEQREATWTALVNDLMKDFDATLESEMRKNLPRLVIGGAGS
jgi:hypothetical protein